MPTSRSILLLTGFGPFPTMGANASAVLVPRIAEAARRAYPGLVVECHILPTEWSEGLWRVTELYRRLRPAAAVHFGVSSRALGFEVETRAQNKCAQTKDAAGLLPDGPVVSPRGPAWLGSTLPAAHIVHRLRRRGIPATLSRDAGAYLCNALLYRTQEIVRENDRRTRSGFIHLPSDLVDWRNPRLGPLGGCRLGWRDVVDGGVEVVAATLGQPPAAAVMRAWRSPESVVGRAGHALR